MATSSVSLTELKRYEVDNQLYLSPEAFLALNIFEDARHPSAHGTQADAGPSHASARTGHMHALTSVEGG